MQKIKPLNRPRAPLKKPAVILFLTVTFIILISGVVALYFSLSQKSITRSNKELFLVQTAIFMKDIKQQLFPLIDKTIQTAFASMLSSDENSSKQKIELYNKFFYDLPIPIKSKYLRAALLCSAGNSRLNINRLKQLPRSFRFALEQRLKIYLSQKYELLSPDVLFELIHYALELEPRHNSYLYSKEDLEINRAFDGVNKINGFVAFEKITQDYISLTSDKNIGKVAWADLIQFSGDFLDFNQMPKPLCEALFLYSKDASGELCTKPPRAKTRDEIAPLIFENEREALDKLNISFDFNPLLVCKLDYTLNKVSARLEFDYLQRQNEASVMDNFSFTIH